MPPKHPRTRRATARAAKVAKPSRNTRGASASNNVDALPNSKGLATLPVEILQMIVEFIPDFPIPCKALAELPQEDTSYLMHRRRALHSLIQVCRWLRRACLPMAWSSLAVIDDIWRQESLKDYDKSQATALVEQLEIVQIRNSALLSHIRTVNVGLSRYCFRSVYAEFARALSQMPNLETLQILDAPVETEAIRKALSQAMAKFTYPSVKTLSCIIHLLDIAPHFPNVEHVTLLHARLNYESDINTELQILKWKHTPPAWMSSGCWDNVKRLDLTSEMYLSGHSYILYRCCLWRALPNIEVLPFLFPVPVIDYGDFDQNALKEQWLSHRHLTAIHFELADDGLSTSPASNSTIYAIAREVLQSRPHTQERTIRIYRQDTVLMACFRDRGISTSGLLSLLSLSRKDQECTISEVCRTSFWHRRYPWMDIVESQILSDDNDDKGEWITIVGDDKGFIAPPCATARDEKMMERLRRLSVTIYSLT